MSDDQEKLIGVMRFCRICGEAFYRRENESPAHFARRKTCGSRACRFHGNGQVYSMEDKALVRRCYPEGGAVAVWYQGWPHKEGGKQKQLAKIRLLAYRLGVKMEPQRGVGE